MRGSKIESTCFKDSNFLNVDFSYCSAEETEFINCKIQNCNLSNISFIKSDFTNSLLENCRVYGISSWDVVLDNTVQKNLIITKSEDLNPISVESIEIAQFLYLLINNIKLRSVIDTLTTKIVLILGRFTIKRKSILDKIKCELRKYDFVPVLFDFEKPNTLDITETIQILANMSKFIIADLSDAKSIPQELTKIIPNFPSVIVQPIILEGIREYGMFEHFKRYPWVLNLKFYNEHTIHLTIKNAVDECNSYSPK
jgi:hypothetical protein